MRPLTLIACVALAACATAQAPAPLQSETPIRWVRTFSSPQDDWINDVTQLRSGRYLAVGFLGREGWRSDWRALAVEITERGRVTRQFEYGRGAGADAFWNMSESENGERAFAGFTSRLGAGGIDAWFARTDARGALIDEAAYGEADYDRVTDLAPAPDGWILVGHSVIPGTEARRVLMLRIANDGREVWRRTITQGETAGALYIERTPEGAYVLSGGVTRNGDSDLLLMKFDADGRDIWLRTYGAPGTADINHGLVVRPDGALVAVGYTASWGAESYDMFALTLAPDGDEIRRSVIGGAGDDRTIGARLGPDGRIWLIGYTQSAGAGDWDVIVTALDETGAFFPGAAVLAGEGDDNGASVLPLADGDLLIAGYSTSFGDQAQDAFLARIAAPDLSRPDPRFRVR